MKKTRSQRTLIGRNKTPFYWLIGERTKLQRRTQLQRYTWLPQLRNSAEWDWVQIFLENKYGGECRHGKTMSFCTVLSFPAYKYQEKVSMNFFNGPLDIRRRDVWTVHGWLHSLWFGISASSVILTLVNFRATVLLYLLYFSTYSGIKSLFLILNICSEHDIYLWVLQQSCVNVH